MTNVTEKSEIQVVSCLNYSKFRKNGKKFKQASQTIPDQSLTMRQLLDRYARGQDLGGISRTPIWDEEEESEGINPATLDLADIEEMKLHNAKKIKQLQTKIEDDEKDKTKKATEEATATAVRRAMDERERKVKPISKEDIGKSDWPQE